MATERLTRLLAEYRQALDRDPRNPQLMLGTARLLDQTGRVREALPLFLAAGEAFLQQRQPTEARAACAHALAIDPANVAAVQLLRTLEGDDGAGAAHRVREGAPVVLGPDGDPWPADRDGPFAEPTHEVSMPAPTDEPSAWREADTMISATDVPPGAAVPAESATVELEAPAAPGEETGDPPKGRVTDLRQQVLSRPANVPRRREAAREAAAGFLPLPPEVAKTAEMRTFGAGDAIVREGDEGSALFFVDDGRIEITRDADGKRVRLAALEAGGFFGELAALGDGVRHVTARAVAAARVHVLGKQDLRQLMRQDRQANRAIRRAYRDRLRQLVLAISPLFGALSADLTDTLFAAGKPVGMMAQRVVLSQGADPPGFFIVLLGTLEVSRRSGSLREVCGRISEGACFGHPPLLAGGCSEHTVRATSFVQLLQLSPPRFAALLGEHPQLRAAVEADAARWPGG